MQAGILRFRTLDVKAGRNVPDPRNSRWTPRSIHALGEVDAAPRRVGPRAWAGKRRGRRFYSTANTIHSPAGRVMWSGPIEAPTGTRIGTMPGLFRPGIFRGL